LQPTQGTLIQGINAQDRTGASVDGAGDVNGDGIADIIIGAPGGSNNNGTSYIIYGNRGGYIGSVINLANLQSNQGFKIIGAHTGDQAGGPVSGKGDINGDGIADFIISAPLANNSTGTSYAIWGTKSLSNAIYFSYSDSICVFPFNAISCTQ
jgi:hypothetical protein